MASFTIAISGSAVVNGSKSWTISDADVQSLVSYLQATYPGSVPGVPGQTTLTPQQALLAWAQAFVDKTKRDVADYNRSQTAIAPISFT